MLLHIIVPTEECFVEGNEAKLRCIELINCDWAKNLLRQNKFPQTCGFNGTDPKVCCPIAITRTRLKQSADLAQKGMVTSFSLIKTINIK